MTGGVTRAQRWPTFADTGVQVVNSELKLISPPKCFFFSGLRRSLQSVSESPRQHNNTTSCTINMQRFPVCESHRRTQTKEFPSKRIKRNHNKISLLFFFAPWIFYCWFTFMMTCTQPQGSLCVNQREREKKQDLFSPLPSHLYSNQWWQCTPSKVRANWAYWE